MFVVLGFKLAQDNVVNLILFFLEFDVRTRLPVRKSPSLHGRKSTPTPKFLVTAEAYFVCHCPNFQISLIYVFIGCL